MGVPKLLLHIGSSDVHVSGLNRPDLTFTAELKFANVPPVAAPVDAADVLALGKHRSWVKLTVPFGRSLSEAPLVLEGIELNVFSGETLVGTAKAVGMQAHLPAQGDAVLSFTDLKTFTIAHRRAVLERNDNPDVTALRAISSLEFTSPDGRARVNDRQRATHLRDVVREELTAYMRTMRRVPAYLFRKANGPGELKAEKIPFAIVEQPESLLLVDDLARVIVTSVGGKALPEYEWNAPPTAVFKLRMALYRAIAYQAIADGFHESIDAESAYELVGGKRESSEPAMAQFVELRARGAIDPVIKLARAISKDTLPGPVVG